MVKFSNDVFDTICERIAKGESLRKITLDDDMPSATAVDKWLVKDDTEGDGKLVVQYARARERQADHYVEEIVDIADETSHDKYVDEQGNERTNSEVVQRSRLRIDARKWVAGKMRPKKYGEKIIQEHTDTDGGSIKPEIDVVELARRTAFMLREASEQVDAETTKGDD